MKASVLRKLFFALSTVSAIHAFAEWSETEAQAELDATVGLWGVNRVGFRNAVGDAAWRARRSQNHDRYLRVWYCRLLELEIPCTSDLSVSNEWMGAKADVLLELGRSSSVAGDTNCWFATAREHGMAVTKDVKEWYEIAGIATNALEVLPDGVIVLDSNIQNGGSNDDRIAFNKHIDDARRMKKQFSIIKESARRNMRDMTLSPAFCELIPSDRNSIVSNIVEMAHFTPDEAASLGLTNVTQQASN